MVEVYLLKSSGHIVVIKAINKQMGIFNIEYESFVKLTWKSYHGTNPEKLCIDYISVMRIRLVELRYFV